MIGFAFGTLIQSLRVADTDVLQLRHVVGLKDELLVAACKDGRVLQLTVCFTKQFSD